MIKNSVDFIRHYAGKTVSKIVVDSPKAVDNVNAEATLNIDVNSMQ